MRNNTVNVLAGIQPGQALAPRGGALRTFGGLALLLAVAFLALGAYLIEDEITNPHASQSLGLFAGGLPPRQRHGLDTRADSITQEHLAEPSACPGSGAKSRGSRPKSTAGE